jgi:hypothetical protein
MLFQALGQPVLAQSEPEPGNGGGNAPICMIRSIGTIDAPSSGQPGGSSVIVVVPRSIPELQARGFVIAPCDQHGLQTSAQFATYRDQVCELAGSGNEATQTQVFERIGEYPAVLCANAEKVSGFWDHVMSGAE